MGGRALLGILLGIAIVVVAVVVGSRCLPKPGKKIEWVQRADAVVVQMKTSGGDDPVTGWADPLRPPRFTLYGDGTLIVPDVAKTCSEATGVCETLWETKLSHKEVSDLLNFISDTGFFNFNYKQPQPAVSGAPTAYIFVAAKETQNAVAANALHADAPNVAEWDQFRKVQEIKTRLDTIASSAVADGAAIAYARDAIVLNVQYDGPAIPIVSAAAKGPLEWPFADIDLASIAPESGFGERRIEGDQALAVLNSATPINGGTFIQAGQRFSVAYRPVLPYEENFPEFEGQ